MEFITEKKGDTQTYIIKAPKGYPQTMGVNEFRFTGFSNKLHPYYRMQLNWVCEVLKSKGIILYVKIVPTQEQIPGSEKGYIEPGDIRIPAEYVASEDEKCYYLIMDEEMGRGWAVLLSEKEGQQEIIEQEHRDSVIDWLIDGEFIRSFGIDYTVKNK